MLATIAARTFTRQLLIVMTTGFALFAMFFGSGNLVFPVMIGAHAHENYGIATVGLILSGVVLPFIGIFAVVKNKGSYSVLFNRMSHLWAFTIPFFFWIAQLSLGSYAGLIVIVCIGLACLTSALVLTRVFVDYLYVAFPRLKIKQQTLMIGTVLVSFLVSTLEFHNIAAYIGPIMVILYPGLIALALTGLSENPKWHRWTQPLVLSAFALGALSYFGKPLTSYL